MLFRSLDETTRNVYRENVELMESLRVYKERLDEFQKTKDQLTKFIARTDNDKELNEILIKEKVDQIQKQNNTIREVKPSKNLPFFFSSLFICS